MKSTHQPSSTPKLTSMLKRCPKCGGYLNPRTGYPVPVAWSCINCGLSAESGSFYDALGNKTVEVRDARSEPI